MALTKVDDRGLKTPIDLLDNEKIRLGTGNDLELYHNATNNILNSGNGKIELRHTVGGADEAMAKFIPNGAAELYHNDSKKLETSSSGVTITGDANWNDDGKAEFGNAADLKIYHDASHSYLNNSTGRLRIQGDDVRIENAAGSEFLAKFTADGAAELYYDDSKKLETVTGGVKVTGELAFAASSGNNPIINNTDGGNGNALHFETGGADRLIIDSSGHTHFGNGTLNDSNVVSIVPADGRISFGMDGRSSFVTGENGAYIYSGDGVSGTTVAGDLILQSRSNQDRTIRFVTGSSPAQRLSINHHGLLFGTDAAAANSLDDYEEGTWTPVVVGGIDGGAQYAANRGWYTKVGRLVQVSFYLHLVNASTGSTGNGNHAILDGLPFHTANLSPGYNSGGMVTYTSMSMAGGHTQISLYVDNSDDRIWLYRERDEVASWTTGANDNKNKSMYGYITYFTAT